MCFSRACCVRFARYVTAMMTRADITTMESATSHNTVLLGRIAQIATRAARLTPIQQAPRVCATVGMLSKTVGTETGAAFAALACTQTTENATSLKELQFAKKVRTLRTAAQETVGMPTGRTGPLVRATHPLATPAWGSGAPRSTHPGLQVIVRTYTLVGV